MCHSLLTIGDRHWRKMAATFEKSRISKFTSVCTEQVLYTRDVVVVIKTGAYIHGVLILCRCLLSRFYGTEDRGEENSKILFLGWCKNGTHHSFDSPSLPLSFLPPLSVFSSSPSLPLSSLPLSSYPPSPSLPPLLPPFSVLSSHSREGGNPAVCA